MNTKTTFHLILMAVCVTFVSCHKDDLSTRSSSITSDGLLTGKIVNYVPNSIDSLSAYYTNDVGSSKVSTNGDFSIRLNVPQLEKINLLSGVTVSDTTAMGASVNINAYLKNIDVGGLKKCNYITTDSIKAGMSYSMFFYVDKTFSVKGTHVEINGFNTRKLTVVYDVTFKKGWNELVYKITSYSSTGLNETTSAIYTNIITSDLQWHFFTSDKQSIRGELSSKVKVEKIFSSK